MVDRTLRDLPFGFFVEWNGTPGGGGAIGAFEYHAGGAPADGGTGGGTDEGPGLPGAPGSLTSFTVALGQPRDPPRDRPRPPLGSAMLAA